MSKLKSLDYIIFTDGSVVWNGRYPGPSNMGREYAAYASVLLNVKTKEYTVISSELTNRTIVYCECYAVYKGLDWLARHCEREKDINVLVVSDSQLTVQAIGYYIPYLWNLKNPNCWRKANGEIVKGQSAYKLVKGVIDKHPWIHMKIIHIRAHKDIERYWPEMKEYFTKHGVRSSHEATKLFMYMNRLADEVAHSLAVEAREFEIEHGLFYRLKPTKLGGTPYDPDAEVLR